jgi:hypothetical protein
MTEYDFTEILLRDFLRHRGVTVTFEYNCMHLYFKKKSEMKIHEGGVNIMYEPSCRKPSFCALTSNTTEELKNFFGLFLRILFKFSVLYFVKEFLGEVGCCGEKRRLYCTDVTRHLQTVDTCYWEPTRTPSIQLDSWTRKWT